MIKGAVAFVILVALAFWGSDDASRDEILARCATAAVIVFIFPLIYLFQLYSIPAKLADEEAAHRANLESRIASKLLLTFDMQVPGCCVQTRFGSGTKATFFRIKVEHHGVGILHPCVGRLIGITKNGQATNYADSLQLTWVPATAPDALSKGIADQVPEFLDICFMTERGEFTLATREFSAPFSMERLFAKDNDYELTIVVSCTTTTSKRLTVRLHLGENDKTTTMECVSLPPAAPSDSP